MNTIQVQCPHCSGFRVTSKIGLVKNDSAKQVSATSWGLWSLIFVFLGPVMLIGGIVETLKEFGDTTFGSCFIVGGAILTAIMILKIIITNKNAKNTHKVTYYKCELCGKEWEVHQGESQPPLENQINPSLAGLGAKKLEEEEAERKRQEEAAAGAYILSQKK